MYCVICGNRRISSESFCIKCGSPFRAVIAQAKYLVQSEFRDQRISIFWGYLIGLFTFQLFTFSIGNSWFIGLLNLLEVSFFILAFLRARQNWIVLWTYLLTFSAVLSLFEYAMGSLGLMNPFSVFISLAWFALVPVLVWWHYQISKLQGLQPFKITSDARDW